MHQPILRTDVYEVIADELEDILTGACCVRGDVAELFDRFPDGLNVRHVMRVDHAACSQQSRRLRAQRGGRHASTREVVREVKGSGIADVTSLAWKVWLEFHPLVYLSRYERPARLH